MKKLICSWLIISLCSLPVMGQLRLKVEGDGYLTGKLGVGTSAPLDKLHVIGDLRLEDPNPAVHFYAGATRQGFLGQRLTFPVSTDLYLSNEQNSNLYFQTNAITRMTLTSIGKLGIGTTAPADQLHLLGNLRMDSAEPQLKMYNGNLLLGWLGISGPDLYLSNVTQNRLHLRTNNLNRLSIDPTGRVGIGTTTPGDKLEVLGNMRVNNTSPTYFLYNGIDQLGMLGYFGSNLLLYNFTAGDLAIGTDGRARMTVTNEGNIGIGTAFPDYPLHIYPADTVESALYVQRETNTPDDSYGIKVVVEEGAGDQGKVFGISVSADGDSWAHGGYFGSRALNSYGVRGDGYNLSDGTGVAYGVYGFGYSNFLIFNPTPSSMRFGVYGDTNGDTDDSGDGIEYAVFASGDLGYVDDLIHASDRRLKRGVEPLPDALKIIMRLNPVSYYHQIGEYPQMGLGSGKNYGFIAQEVEQVLPDLVSPVVLPAIPENDENGRAPRTEMELKGLNEIGLLPFLTKAVQQQQAQLEDQGAVINNQQTEIKELKHLVGALLQRLEYLEGRLPEQALPEAPPSAPNTEQDNPYLEQNVPNPFNQETSIRYYLPGNTHSAVIRIVDRQGRIVKLYALQGTGKGAVSIGAESLAPGTYFYLLFVNGEAVDSRQMVLLR